MGNVINLINITSVVVERDNDGKYKIELTWQIDGNPARLYPGNYDICLLNQNEEIETKTVVSENNYATVTFTKITDDTKYYIIVKVSQGKNEVKSPRVSLIIDYYKGFSGSYDGKILSLAWELDKMRIPEGCCSVTADNGYEIIYTIYPGGERTVIDGVCFRAGRKLTVKVWSMSSVCQGPYSEELTFYTAPPFITRVENAEGNGGADITVYFTTIHEDIETVALVFSVNGEVVYETKPVTVSLDKEENVYSVTAHIDSLVLSNDEIEKSTISCAYINGNAKTMISGEGSSMPLARPTVKAEDIQSGKAVMRISYPHNIAARGFEPAGGNIVCGDTYIADPADTAMVVYPRFDKNGIKRKGVPSKPASGFIQGYYLSADERMIYRNTGFAENTVTHIWNEELFKIPPAEPIVSGAISLICENGRYTLALETTDSLSLKDYDGFMDIIKDNVTPSGFFALNDAILRMSPQALDDTPYLFCAYNPKTGLSDIRPGMKLTANTAVYMPQYNSYFENAQGFVSTNNIGWCFIFDKDSGFLEPDLFIGKMAKYMDWESLNWKTLNPDMHITYASGVADFMSPSFRQPYYRILFPSSLMSSVEPENPFPSNNTVILAAESYGAVLDACEAVGKDPNNINRLNVPMMIFRGRSVLSLSVPVQINGNICYVPVGCNASQALNMYGIGSTVKMMREDDNHIPRPVFSDKDADLGKTVLIPGDRLEV